MLEISVQNQFKRDVKLAQKRSKDMVKLSMVINKLAAEEALDEKYKDHVLKGNYKNCRECHIEPDWLLIYFVDKEKELLYLFRTGTHADLFD